MRRDGPPEEPADGGFVPQVDRVLLSPGSYRLEAQILDLGSRKTQVYHRDLRVRSFGGDSLALSDVELASAIRPDGGGPFQKNGVGIVPNPSRTFLKGQRVGVYYEIYNLKKDAFGQTRYRVSYEVEARGAGQRGSGVISLIGQVIHPPEETVALGTAYEQAGDQTDDVVYLEIEIPDVGAGKHVLIVNVTDEVAGTRAQVKAPFNIHA
jgi:hypothetical protein